VAESDQTAQRNRNEPTHRSSLLASFCARRQFCFGIVCGAL
ncbi:MAG: hypothetical protein BDTLLHRC_000403, partial [Candidatus Fervidibacter sp.]